MALLQIRIDDDLKNQANAVYKALGIDLSTAVRMFLKRSVVEGGLPFDANLDKSTLEVLLAVDRMQTISEQNGNSEMTLDEINDIIAKARKEGKHNK